MISSCRNLVVLVDVALRPAPDAAESVIRAVTDAGGIPVAMGVGGDPETIFRALRWGAAGYLTKDLPIDAWVQAVRAAFARRGTAVPDDDRRAGRGVPQPGEHRADGRAAALGAAADAARVGGADADRGRQDQPRVASDLSISVQTVRTHVSNILAKLEAPNRSAAAAKYQQLQAVRG